jgi:hypothetical protein
MFRDFLVKYPESNRLHKRMLLASRRIEASGDAEARKELYQGQCNDSLWHGIFGGLYLPHLRESSYAHLLEAEKTLPGESERGWTIEDYDADGEREGTIRGRTFALIVKPHPGGALAEIDHYPLARNLVDVLARRRESYHTERAAGPAGGGGSIHELARNLPGESGKRLRYDEHERLSGLDRVYDRSAAIRTLDDVASLDRVGFASRPYSLELAGTVLRTRRSGEASLDGGPFLIDVEKTFALEDAAVRAFWSLTNRSGSPVEFLFGVEWTLYQTREELRIESPKATLCGGRLCLCADGAEIVAFPVETLSQSEQGYDVIHQGYCLLALWPVSIPAGGAFRTGILLGDAS